jgi:hypothetical protein
MPPSSPSVTELLQAWGRGDTSARDQLVPAVYQELRLQAHRYLQREQPGHTLETTALVHKVYLRLVDQRQADWRNRAHFFGIAGQMMRRVLIDYARGKRGAKRGGGGIQPRPTHRGSSSLLVPFVGHPQSSRAAPPLSSSSAWINQPEQIARERARASAAERPRSRGEHVLGGMVQRAEMVS